MIKTIENNLIDQENEIYNQNSLQIKSNVFMQLMDLYSQAIEEVKNQIQYVENKYGLVDHIKTRIKAPNSIIKKMKDKNYEVTYQNLIENVNDIAGIRIITKTKEDIYKIKEKIENETNLTILKEKDYIKNPKKSGYMSLHLIVEVPINIDNQIVFVKAEIQLRTIAMDFWANLEHEIKYKPKSKITKSSSRKLILYAKILNKMENEMASMYKKM